MLYLNLTPWISIPFGTIRRAVAAHHRLPDLPLARPLFRAGDLAYPLAISVFKLGYQELWLFR